MRQHPISEMFSGETCDICERDTLKAFQATHKVGEELAYDDPSFGKIHNTVAYVCCSHFHQIFGRPCDR